MQPCGPCNRVCIHGVGIATAFCFVITCWKSIYAQARAFKHTRIHWAVLIYQLIYGLAYSFTKMMMMIMMKVTLHLNALSAELSSHFLILETMFSMSLRWDLALATAPLRPNVGKVVGALFPFTPRHWNKEEDKGTNSSQWTLLHFWNLSVFWTDWDLLLRRCIWLCFFVPLGLLILPFLCWNIWNCELIPGLSYCRSSVMLGCCASASTS